MPPVAERTVAMGPLHSAERLPLWCGAALCLAWAWAVWRRPSGGRLAAAGLPLLLLVGIELTARVVMARDPELRQHLLDLSARTYPDLVVFQAHPFLQFTGRPKARPQDSAQMRWPTPFNELGFLGPMHERDKPAHVLRVVCHGGSTTATGFPDIARARLQRALDENGPVRGRTEVQAFNFGIGYYTSAHSLVNLVLNGLWFSPDYVVFHHAWNDGRVRDVRAEARSDYSHVLRRFSMPPIPDRWLLRASVIYRGLQDAWFETPAWGWIGAAAMRGDVRYAGAKRERMEDLRWYERNVRTFADLALARGVVPVLTTQPYNRAPEIGEPQKAHVEQCNQRMREIAESYGDAVLFVDLDAAMLADYSDVFLDLGHMNDRGIHAKAALIADAIWAHLN